MSSITSNKNPYEHWLEWHKDKCNAAISHIEKQIQTTTRILDELGGKPVCCELYGCSIPLFRRNIYRDPEERNKQLNFIQAKISLYWPLKESYLAMRKIDGVLKSFKESKQWLDKKFDLALLKYQSPKIQPPLKEIDQLVQLRKAHDFLFVTIESDLVRISKAVHSCFQSLKQYVFEFDRRLAALEANKPENVNKSWKEWLQSKRPTNIRDHDDPIEWDGNYGVGKKESFSLNQYPFFAHAYSAWWRRWHLPQVDRFDMDRLLDMPNNILSYTHQKLQNTIKALDQEGITGCVAADYKED